MEGFSLNERKEDLGDLNVKMGRIAVQEVTGAWEGPGLNDNGGRMGNWKLLF